MRIISVVVLLLLSPLSHAAGINPVVAAAYNDGIVRCGNSECAKYLYACFRTYSTAELQDFLACGTQASRLNDDELVVANPNS